MNHESWISGADGELADLCSAFQVDLSCLVDGELEDAAATRAMLHLEECPSCRGFFSSFCSAFASVWSLSSHCGMPTFWMFAHVVSATTLLKCCGHAAPRTLVGSRSTPAIMAAALA